MPVSFTIQELTMNFQLTKTLSQFACLTPTLILGRARIGIKRPMEITLILSNTCAFKRVAFPLAAIIYSSHKVGADALISPQYRSSFGERALHFFITMMGVVTHYQQIELV